MVDKDYSAASRAQYLRLGVELIADSLGLAVETHGPFGMERVK